jgi:hypothetical protein
MAFGGTKSKTRGPKISGRRESFEKCSNLFKEKGGENYNHRNTISILRINL